MSIEIDAVYREGAFHPDRPMGIPEGSRVKLLAPGLEEQSDLDAIRAALLAVERGDRGVDSEEFVEKARRELLARTNTQ